MIATARMGTEPVEIPNNHCAKMNILLWNCRGALGLDFKRHVLEMMVNHFPSILIITETRVSGDRAARIIEDLPFDGFFTTEKSRIYFSPNFHEDIKDRICTSLGIQATTCLGKYLGMPLKHKGAARS